MTAIALAFSLLIVALGVLGLVMPSRLLGIERYMQTRAALYGAAAIRLVMGVSLYFAAPASRAPDILRILGFVVVAAGLLTLSLGLERFRGVVAWWLAHASRYVRAWASVALVLGVLLTYALLP